MPEIFFAESRYAELDSETPALWEYRREMKADGIRLPLHLAHGYDADELNRDLFFLHSKGDIIILKVDSMNAGLKVLFSEDGKYFNAGSTMKTQKRKFYLLCKDDKRGLKVLITCEVKANGRY